MRTIARPAPGLRQTQAAILSLILNRHAADAEEVAAWIADPPRGTRSERLAVYLEGYPARMHEALEESYPAVTHLIGHRASDALVDRYVATLSRHSYNLNDAGSELPDFLDRDQLAERFPFLPDLARLEWALVHAFHARERRQLDRARLATLTASQWLDVVLVFQPSVAVLRSAWPIHSLWEAREVPLEQIDIEVHNRSQSVLVRREGAALHCESIDDTEATVIEALLAGRALGELGDILAAEDGDYVDVSPWFARWMQQGLIVGCDSSLGPRRARA